MSQWGRIKTIEGCKFIPLIKTSVLEGGRIDSTVEDIICFETGETERSANTLLGYLKKKYNGRQYNCWLSGVEFQDHNLEADTMEPVGKVVPDLARLAMIYEIYSKISASNARVQGMAAENKQRKALGESMAYNGSHFEQEAGNLDRYSYQLSSIHMDICMSQK
jgi:hypothetical protein